MKAGELCTREVVTAWAGESVVDAARRMRDHDVGTVVVVEDVDGVTRPVGLVTDRDLVMRVLARGEPLAALLRDVMDPALVTATEDDDVDTVLARLRRRAVRRVPIVDRTGALRGVLSLDDIVGWISEELRDAVRLIERQAPPHAR
ncbi:MAG: CBS domain-containing protein [Kofleriaceae bacterium]|nr:CBS domain-containing protein [Myxococcales bacterium]MCB9564267.1 CBS domain-containing protein [Kofleriaceae bacterium]MCB9574457.1 CBS domain-containing protein [Kofleriaceae bacterium]